MLFDKEMVHQSKDCLNSSNTNSKYFYYNSNSTNNKFEGFKVCNNELDTNKIQPPPIPKKLGIKTKLKSNVKLTHQESVRNLLEHQRAGSLTDSEESESSISGDSLVYSEFIEKKWPKLSPLSSGAALTATAISTTKLSVFPDSLLQDIRDRKNSNINNINNNNNEYIRNNNDIKNNLNYSENNDEYFNTKNYFTTKIQYDYPEYIKISVNNNKKCNNNNKTCVLIRKDSSTEIPPQSYENDRYYNFHVSEYNENNNSNNNNNDNSKNSLSSENNKNFDDQSCFAGYKDITNSTTNTIRSTKGTVRGIKNRVRNGIETFLQMQNHNQKNFKEKDIGKVVVYTTSMGIIRDTYAKCCNVKQILRTLLVKFEERDVFMSTEYQQEIKERMHCDEIQVPQVFVEGQYIGDADAVEKLNESGELRKLLQPYKSLNASFTCQVCGGYRLLPCSSCNGSKKSVHRNHFTAEFVALKCMNCDEVGLVKCHNC